MTEASQYFPDKGLPIIDQAIFGIEAPSTIQPLETTICYLEVLQNRTLFLVLLNDRQAKV